MTNRNAMEPIAASGASQLSWPMEAMTIGAKPKADPKSGAVFQSLMPDGGSPAAFDAVNTALDVKGSPLDNITLGLERKGSQNGRLSPTQQFESFVLRTFVESMLPSKNTDFYGEGTAGDIWKSMLAERIGDEMARGGGIGIAKMLDERKADGGTLANAKAGLVKDQAAMAGASAVRR